MLQCFSDDSGSDPKDRGIFALFGYVMEHTRWEHFAEMWYQQLHRPDFFRIDYFKMSQAEAGDGLFSGIDGPLRQRKVRDLAEVIRFCEPTPIGCQVRWSDYNEIIKGKVDPRLDNPYAILFFQLMRGLAELQIRICDNVSDEFKKSFEEQFGLEFAVKPVEFIFDDQNNAGLQALQFWGPLKSKLTGPHAICMSNTPQFKNDKDVVPLQAADMLAWHMRRLNDYPGENRDVVLNMLTPEGLFHRQIERDELEWIVQQFNSDLIVF